MEEIVTCEFEISSGGKSANCVKGSVPPEKGDTSSSQVKCSHLGQILLQGGCAKLSALGLVQPL